MKSAELPIETVIGDLKEALHNAPNALLTAPPGAGKTTIVPIRLLAEPWLAGQTIVMLEPRRLAAKAAARQMARLMGEPVGETVGYRVRMENRTGPRTRIEVVTEGILTRRIQNDPSLRGVGLVIFDEFHERSIHADLGLALCLDAQEGLREDLRILVMSATLDVKPVAGLLSGARIISCPGQLFPVKTRYVAPRPGQQLVNGVIQTVNQALSENSGNILAFLPGAGEIRHVEKLMGSTLPPDKVRVFPLFGNLPRAAQEQAIAPAPMGMRKVVLATDIAETSLTIDGIRVVVDCGFRRTPRFNVRTGMSRLETVRVSQASARQRRGRAGRLAAGVCYRLWSRGEHQTLADHSQPEMLHADLAPLVLELALWGVNDHRDLKWLDLPPASAVDQARALLGDLGALDTNGRITAHGRHMAELGIHPRLAHMMIRARHMGVGATACELAAILSELEIIRSRTGPVSTDLRLRAEALGCDPGTCKNQQVAEYIDAGACKRVHRSAAFFRKRLGVTARENDMNQLGVLVAHAYPDRIAQRRAGSIGRYLLSGGRGAYLPDGDPLAVEEYIAVAHLDGGQREGRIFLAAPIAPGVFESEFSDRLQVVDSITWDSSRKAVTGRRQTRLGSLVLREDPLQSPDSEKVAATFLDGIRRSGTAALPWTRKLRSWQMRAIFLRQLSDNADRFPDLCDSTLLSTLENWLLPFIPGMTRLNQLKPQTLSSALKGMLTWEQQKMLDELAPSHLKVPSGSLISLDYSQGEAPVLAVRLQEMFGETQTPRVAAGRIPVILHLLSPAGRPVQVTQDLAGFWAGSYESVRKEMRGRYPKHHWPDDPLLAQATNRAKRPQKKAR